MGRGEWASVAISVRARSVSKVLRNAERVRKLFDPTAGDDEVTRIEHRGLSWRHGALRLVEAGFGAVLVQRTKSGPGRNMAVANAHADASRHRQAGPGKPADIARDQGGAEQIVVRSDRHLLGGRICGDDVKRFLAGDPDPFALADGEMVGAAMASDFAARGIDNCAFRSGGFDALIAEVRIHKSRVVAVG